MIYTLLYTPLLYITFMADSRYIRYHQFARPDAPQQEYARARERERAARASSERAQLIFSFLMMPTGTHDCRLSFRAANQMDDESDEEEESAEEEAKRYLRYYPTINWIDISTLRRGKRIGKGGMGEVFVAQWQGTIVALKVRSREPNRVRLCLTHHHHRYHHCHCCRNCSETMPRMSKSFTRKSRS